MKQLDLFTYRDEKESQLRKRLATPLKPNSAYREVTNCTKPEGGSCWAATKVNVLSSEINHVLEADVLHFTEGNMGITDKGEVMNTLAESEAVARQHVDNAGTREIQHVLRKEVCVNKSENGEETQTACWKSDLPIVLRKQGNACGGKGQTRGALRRKETPSARRGGLKVRTKLRLITDKAKRYKELKFTSLIHLLSEEFLIECYYELKKGKASGVDDVTVEEYGKNLEENIRGLVERLKRWEYKPKPVRRVYIQKDKGGKRPLGVPCVEDKIVQMGIKLILEAIWECDFLENSFGFRPNRNCHDALNYLDKEIMTKPINYIADLDIRKFFDNVNHEVICKGLRVRIADRNFIRLIVRFLKAGVMEEGELKETEEGTPQGAILSPVLANIYLHYVLDLWFEKKAKREQLRGYCSLVRYADDFVICIQTRRDAEMITKLLKDRFMKFGLTISEEKSKVIEFGRNKWKRAKRKGDKIETFDFLGFTHYCDETRRGYFKLERRTSKGRLSKKLKAMNQWLKGIRNMVKLEEWWEILKMKLIGHYRYYGVSGNAKRLNAFFYRVIRLAFKWVNRRSQKKSYNWKQFSNRLLFNPLPRPKIYVNFYTIKPV